MASTSGTSVLPTARARRPDAFIMSVTMVVTVVLPSVPVTASTGRSSQAAARSNSLSTGHTGLTGGGEDGVAVGHAGAGQHRVGLRHQRCQLGIGGGFDQVHGLRFCCPAPGRRGMVVHHHDLGAVGPQGRRHGLTGDGEPHHQGVSRRVPAVPGVGSHGAQSNTSRRTKSA